MFEKSDKTRIFQYLSPGKQKRCHSWSSAFSEKWFMLWRSLRSDIYVNNIQKALWNWEGFDKLIKLPPKVEISTCFLLCKLVSKNSLLVILGTWNVHTRSITRLRPWYNKNWGSRRVNLIKGIEISFNKSTKITVKTLKIS